MSQNGTSGCAVCTVVSLCMGISDKIEVMTIAIDKAMIVDIELTIALPFQSSLTSLAV